MGEIGSDIVDGVVNTAKDIKDTATEGVDAYQSSSEIVHNTDGTADLLNELYDDDTAATAGRMMVDEDLFEAVALVGGLGKGAIKGIKKLGGGKVEVTTADGKTVVVPESLVVKGSDGEFSIIDWKNYPNDLPKPEGPFRLISGDEYNEARKAANKANKKIRKDNDLTGVKVDVHEIKPVKFNGSPTTSENKIIIDRDKHRQEVTPWWNNIQKHIEKANNNE